MYDNREVREEQGLKTVGSLIHMHPVMVRERACLPVNSLL